MDFRLISYNLTGLTILEDKLKTRDLLFGLEAPLDILSVQEHKIRAQNIKWLPPIWTALEFIISPTGDGTHA